MNGLSPLRLHGAPGLAFAAAASLAELAPIAQLLDNGKGLIPIVATGLAYQVGGALARWAPGGCWTWRIAAAGGGVVLLTLPSGHLAWLLAVVALAWSLQAARRRHAHAYPSCVPSTARKRTARVVGFVLAPLLPFWASILVLILTIAAAVHLCPRAEPFAAPRFLGHPIELVMVLHQMHYFTYCYALLLILSAVAGGPKLVGIWFGIGWITYLSAERLWHGTSLSHALICGHLFVALTLCGLAAFSHVGWMVVLCWTLTGLGGGTVYCLARLHRAEGLPTDSLDIAEDLGHVGGVGVALLSAFVLGFDARALAIVAAGFALTTIAAFLTLLPTGRSAAQEN